MTSIFTDLQRHWTVLVAMMGGALVAIVLLVLVCGGVKKDFLRGVVIRVLCCWILRMVLVIECLGLVD